MTKTQQAPKLMHLDSGEKAWITYDPWSMTYQCARCGTFDESATRHSHFDGERWVPRHYCEDCIEHAI